MSNPVRGAGLPALALVLSAALWGTTWFPFRQLDAGGISGVWAIGLTELAAVAFCVPAFRHHLRGMRWSWPLVAIGLLGGACNTGFVIGAIEGPVMRVTLLLYLAPLWTVVLAHWLLDERIDRTGAAVIGLALAGALTMLWPGNAGWSAFGAADAWGLMAGVTYAGYNVMVRRHLELSVAHKTFASSAGCAVIAALAILAMAVPVPAMPGPGALTLIAGLGVALVAIVVLQQFGLERLPAARASVIMASELVFATLSAWWLAGEVPGLRDWLGGALVLAAALMAARAEVAPATPASSVTQ